VEAKLKHLELIQSIINRMAQNSFLFKGWAITIAVGVSAFATTTTTRGILGVAIGSTAIFWGLDGYYLWLERRFIDLYSKVARKSEVEIDFQMSIDKSNPICRWLEACARPHNVAFYGAIILGDLIAILIVGGKS
jgi:hypothetical protein